MKNNLKFPNTSVVYLNFCGIGKSGNALTRYIKRYDCKKLFSIVPTSYLITYSAKKITSSSKKIVGLDQQEIEAVLNK